MQPKISLQTFTVRRYLKSPKAIERAFARIKETGINAVELAYTKLGKDEIEAVARASKEHDIDIGSSQITFDFLQKNRDWVLEFHLQHLGCEFTSVSVLPHKFVVGDESALLGFAEQLDELGAYFRERGLNLAFHHHDYEYRQYGEKVGLDLLMENTSSKNVDLVLDCYWTQRGGRSPQDMIRGMNGRIKVIHLRDYGVQRKLFDMQPTDLALGQGNLDINEIIQSCKDTDVRYMAIEQSTKAPFEQLQISVDYLKENGHGGLF